MMFFFMGITTANTLWSVIVARIGKFSKNYTTPPNRLWKFFSVLAYFPFKKQHNHGSTNGTVVELQDKDHSKEPTAETSGPLEDTIPEKWNELIVGLDKTFFAVSIIILIGGTVGLFYSRI